MVEELFPSEAELQSCVAVLRRISPTELSSNMPGLTELTEVGLALFGPLALEKLFDQGVSVIDYLKESHDHKKRLKIKKVHDQRYKEVSGCGINAELEERTRRHAAGKRDTKTLKAIVYPEGDEEYTTVMLRNIPNKYTREMLIKQLSLEYKGHFDFMYLPIDFKNKCNVGYGFINFRAQEYTESFVRKFNGVAVRKCLPGNSSQGAQNCRKIVEVTPARVQGLHENVRRLRNSPVMNQLVDHPEWMPLLFNEQGQAEPFPNPDQPLPPVKPRGKNRDHARNIDLVET